MTVTEATFSAHRVAAYLKGRGADRVILFGSTHTGHFYPEHSDIDLFVFGLPADQEAVIWFDTLIAFPNLRLDIFTEASSPEYIKKEALATGIYI